MQSKEVAYSAYVGNVGNISIYVFAKRKRFLLVFQHYHSFVFSV